MQKTKQIKISKEHLEQALLNYLNVYIKEGTITNIELPQNEWTINVTVEAKVDTPVFKGKKNR